MKIGLDIGSTTIKSIVLDDKDQVIYKSYNRHYSHIKEKAIEELQLLSHKFNLKNAKLAISGSAGMGFAEKCNVPFVQEVYATRLAATKFSPNTDVIIELGGEDAKILFLTDVMEVRMNGSCAGGTGAFIDQMATLLNIPIEKMNELAQNHDKIYTIASRCGVFAKSDIQPLLNQGAQKKDIAKSIFLAVVNQTIAGLAQGREICGNVLYLGGPLTFMGELRKTFDEVLRVNGTCPKNSLYFVALGAALSTNDIIDVNGLIQKIKLYSSSKTFDCNKPLFCSKKEYNDFLTRHEKHTVEKGNISENDGDIYLGIDAGSTTVKIVLIGSNEQLLLSTYLSNNGNPVAIVKDFLSQVYIKYPNVSIKASAVTGYGEDLIKNAFNVDFGVVETVAHLTGAKKFMPDVEFIIDIGGQDIKCFKVRNGAIDNIFLNEACSSGCGSFLQTFANALSYSVEDFAKLALFAKSPVDLGSRCTVFMNSSVKQAQKDGASIEDIFAGLALSVVKNAIYKVIRVNSTQELGNNIVVQGGTFLNDAVLRAFEQELGVEAVRPDVAGLMGAYGAAIYAKNQHIKKSKILSLSGIKNMDHKVSYSTCGGCSNNCKLTVNTFSSSSIRYISGNKCEKPTKNSQPDNNLNIYDYKLKILKGYGNHTGSREETVGLPLGLNMYELLPFWHKFFSLLGFSIMVSPVSNGKTYTSGQHTIPSDTVCFPAKLMHGHVEYLLKNGVKNIFYPCMSYNFDEKLGDNHYNCPVVAYYPEVISANVKETENINFIKAYVGLHRRREFSGKIHKILNEYFSNISRNEVVVAANKAYKEYENYLEKIRLKGQEIISIAENENKKIIVLAGRPYHVDPEINHGIDKLILSFDAAIISEDALIKCGCKERLNVLNQWTYHSRLYNAAKYIKNKNHINLIQLVSFGCGIDAITTDEVRDILENENKIYTQLKIDEITNLGAIKIRLRSLFAALDQKE